MCISDPLPVEDFPVKTEEGEYDADANTTWFNEPNLINMPEETILSNENPTSCDESRERRPFSCTQCGRSYGRKNTLQRHLTYECGIEPQFQCPFCPQKCKRKSDRMIHIKRLHKNLIGLVIDKSLNS